MRPPSEVSILVRTNKALQVTQKQCPFPQIPTNQHSQLNAAVLSRDDQIKVLIFHQGNLVLVILKITSTLWKRQGLSQGDLVTLVSRISQADAENVLTQVDYLQLHCCQWGKRQRVVSLWKYVKASLQNVCLLYYTSLGNSVAHLGGVQKTGRHSGC